MTRRFDTVLSGFTVTVPEVNVIRLAALPGSASVAAPVACEVPDTRTPVSSEALSDKAGGDRDHAAPRETWTSPAVTVHR
ncbi:hypothetical protein [Streptomyces sp. NPDC060035]|uniref:hypothetical protein n=1 Tax=Streptomyces sp. NPDC060035 TaxID=3347044 RepID=UPI00369D7207